MKKVITYGTYDLLHRGHIRLLERAKALGDYLIVGITADGFDMARGKVNVQQTLMERIEAVKATGLADEIVIEEYEGQKIDDIQRLGVDIFAIGSDWKGRFDYLKAYCTVVYLERTKGISSTQLRCQDNLLRLGLVGDSNILNKYYDESKNVNGIQISGVCRRNDALLNPAILQLPCVTDRLEELLEVSDALYIVSPPEQHYTQIRTALLAKKHVLVESPIVPNVAQLEELTRLAATQGCVLMDALKTAYATAYYRLLLLVKSGRIGRVVSVDATCTSMSNLERHEEDQLPYIWNSISAWGPTAVLPIFQILGTDYSQKQITSHFHERYRHFDLFTKISFIYPHAVASLKVGQGVKSEGELVISGTQGYIYVPAPWWKTDYFEIRREDTTENKRYFYQLNGEGIQFELITFLKSIQRKTTLSYIDPTTSRAIAALIEDFNEGKDLIPI